MASRAAGPTSVNRPKLVLLAVTAARTALPLSVMLPLAKGLLAVGRTRTFCQVSEHVTPPLLAVFSLNFIWVVEMVLIASAVPLATPSMFAVLAPVPAIRVTRTVGAVPPVSKMNPLGALRMIVPVLTSPLAAS